MRDISLRLSNHYHFAAHDFNIFSIAFFTASYLDFIIPLTTPNLFASTKPF